jgi:hypothetical protein
VKLHLTLVGIVLVCAACSSDDDAGEGKGQLATGGGGSGGSGAGGSAGAADGGAVSNGGAATACTTSADCVTTEYVASIESLDDCYCPVCPSVALNLDEAAKRIDAWEEFCSAWVPENDPTPCGTVKCAAPPESVCEAGVCTLSN